MGLMVQARLHVRVSLPKRSIASPLSTPGPVTHAHPALLTILARAGA